MEDRVEESVFKTLVNRLWPLSQTRLQRREDGRGGWQGWKRWLGGGGGAMEMGGCHKGDRGQGWCWELVTRSRMTGIPPPPLSLRGMGGFSANRRKSLGS